MIVSSNHCVLIADHLVDCEEMTAYPTNLLEEWKRSIEGKKDDEAPPKLLPETNVNNVRCERSLPELEAGDS